METFSQLVYASQDGMAVRNESAVLFGLPEVQFDISSVILASSEFHFFDGLSAFPSSRAAVGLFSTLSPDGSVERLSGLDGHEQNERLSLAFDR